jgi:hypothetical protein
MGGMPFDSLCRRQASRARRQQVTHPSATFDKGQAGHLGSRLLATIVAMLSLCLLLGAGTASAVVIRSQVEAFGPDGTAASSFHSFSLRNLAFNQSTRGLYATDRTTPGIYGFDVSAPPIHQPLAGFSPLSTVAMNDQPGVAVDDTALPSAGNVYLANDSLNGLVYGFDKTGAPLGGNFPIDPTVNSGAPPGSRNVVCGAAVDSAGNLWVANLGTQSILEYSATGVYKGAVSAKGQAAGSFSPCAIAFDSNDDMYASDGGRQPGYTFRYTAASGYTEATLVTTGSGSANAVDRSTHHFFATVISGVAAVNEYDPTGKLISTTSEKDSTGDMIIPTSAGIKDARFRGVAIDSANNRVYVADELPGKIRVFGDALTYPDLTVGTASAIENTTATASGTISAQGVALTDCHFEYVSTFKAESFDDLSSGGSAPCSPAAGSIPADSATHPVSAVLSGLAPNTPYRFRLVAANANGPIATLGGETFETDGPPLVETTGSPVRTTTTARLDARVDPAGAAATYHFEYGDQGPCDANPCSSTPARNIGPNESQKITIKASAGQFKLSFGGETTPELPFNASALEVASALQALPSIGAGNVTATGGPGDLSGTHPYLVTFTGDLASTDVAEVSVLSGEGKNALSTPHSATVETTQAGGGGFNEAQSISVAASAGQLKLRLGVDTSTDIAFNAPAATVAAALEALPSIGAGNVVVSGGPGDASGSSPYLVHFIGALANKDVAQLVASNGTTPLSGTTEFGVQTTVPGGIADEYVFVSAQLEGLAPDTTYDYRVVADNGNSAGPQFGADMTVRTFADEAPLSHGHLPGPVGSDRAWELVSAPDTGGNPVGTSLAAPGAAAVSDSGDRAVYGVAGGTPLSETGTVATRLFAERTPTGWLTKKIYAPRNEATSSAWGDPGGPSDLSTMIVENDNSGKSGPFSIWRLQPDAAPARLFGNQDAGIRGEGIVFGLLLVSDNGSRSIISLNGPQDPAHPAAPGSNNLYDISSGQPQMVDLLPDGTVPPCGFVQSRSSGTGIPAVGDRSSHWVSADGSLVFFPSKGSNCDGSQHIYMRDIPAEETKLVSTPPVSGPDCNAYFIKSMPGAAYFYTQSRLVADDTAPAACGGVEGGGGPGGDIYRYDLGDGTLDCLTCLTPGVEAGVTFSGSPQYIGASIGVADDGSRIYFKSNKRLLSGAATSEGTYRLDVASGNLAYVGSFGSIGDYGASTMTADGAVVAFESADPSLNALGGQQNGTTGQYYRYDDRDRSLVCLSCPADGSAPRGGTGTGEVKPLGMGANTGSMSADGSDFAFTTPTPLVSADQNTAPSGQDAGIGTDVYEWREGRLLLVSDGLISWPAENRPKVSGITPSGDDIFFTAATQYTPDALDGYKRLYDARIGGGFEFPPPPKPCPLEVCQGTPRGAPEEQAPGTATITGVGNPAAHKAKAKKKHHKRRHKKHAKKTAQHKANNNRRAAR